MNIKRDKSYWIILIFLIIIFICSIFLYLNINAGAVGNDNIVIGTLTFKNKTIERKYDTDVIWETIESGLLIRNKDTIRSGDFSDAVLTLKDNTKININENSMIYLDVSENDINLNFAYGSMSLAKKGDENTNNSTLKIKSGNNTVEVKNSELVLEKKGKEEFSFQVKKGTAKISNGTKERELKENESAKLDNSEIKVSEININLNSPDDSGVISGKSEFTPITFKWTARNANMLKLEIAYDSRFVNIYKSYNVDNDSYTANLEQGNYYWRISSTKKKSKNKSIREFSSFRKLTVYTISPPTFLTPKKNQIFTFTDITPIIPFSWKKLEIAKNYRLEISKNSGFTEITKSINTTQSSISIDRLEQGKYFARIIAEPIREDFNIEIAKPISFSIEQKKDLDSPILVSPVNGTEINTLLFSKSGYLFHVKDSPELSSYTFQISPSSNFSKNVLEQSSNTNQIKWNTKLDNGVYYWRVFGNTADGRKTPYSEKGNFSIKETQAIELLSPTDKYSFSINDNPVLFRWKKLPFKSNFQLDISDSPEFKQKIGSIKLEEYSYSQSFSKEGTCFWRVTSYGEDKIVLAKSSIFSFQVEDNVELTPIYPDKNESIDMEPLDSLVFKWKKNNNSKVILFELNREVLGKQVLIVKAKTKNTSYVLKDLSKLDEGNFVWTLQVSSDKNGQSKSRKKLSIPFKIFLSNKPSTPQIKTPKKMYVE